MRDQKKQGKPKKQRKIPEIQTRISGIFVAKADFLWYNAEKPQEKS